MRWGSAPAPPISSETVRLIRSCCSFRRIGALASMRASLDSTAADLSLPPRKGRWELEIRAEEPVIDGPDFDARPRVPDDAVSRAETRHAGYHVRSAILRCDKEFVNSRIPISCRRWRAREASRSQA